VDNTQPLGAGEVVPILAAVCVAGRWDYDDALAGERAAATARKLLCEEPADNAVPGRGHADQRAVRVADYRLTERAAEVLLLRCIVVAN
jgi:hypothetical protein